MNEFSSCLNKQKEMEKLFASCSDADSRYQKIIELGKSLPPFDSSLKIPENVVKGCQSVTYLHAFLQNGKVYFKISSDALISAGLAALLVNVYNEEPPETILKCPPLFLENIGISKSLTPNRAQGLYSIHLRMKQEALKLMLNH
jgi:cysteine desulfuration protein SufE